MIGRLLRMLVRRDALLLRGDRHCRMRGGRLPGDVAAHRSPPLAQVVAAARGGDLAIVRGKPPQGAGKLRRAGFLRADSRSPGDEDPRSGNPRAGPPKRPSSSFDVEQGRLAEDKDGFQKLKNAFEENLAAIKKADPRRRLGGKPQHAVVAQAQAGQGADPANAGEERKRRSGGADGADAGNAAGENHRRVQDRRGNQEDRRDPPPHPPRRADSPAPRKKPSSSWAPRPRSKELSDDTDPVRPHR